MSSLVEIYSVVLEKKMKMWAVYDDNIQQTNFDSKNLIRKAHLSLWLRSAKHQTFQFSCSHLGPLLTSDNPRLVLMRPLNLLPFFLIVWKLSLASLSPKDSSETFLYLNTTKGEHLKKLVTRKDISFEQCKLL